ncbi:hypothetical protein [Streptomyces sp. NPDC007905]|uniref:hypothetical protein n=1 Tax=Streptomyces sp. NPDC007905 TaxID=3364788 RepID=UPI0036F03CC2
MIHDQALACDVSNAPTSTPHVWHTRTIDESGRGLLIATLTNSRGVRYSTGGQTVWAQQTIYAT